MLSWAALVTRDVVMCHWVRALLYTMNRWEARSCTRLKAKMVCWTVLKERAPEVLDFDRVGFCSLMPLPIPTVVCLAVAIAAAVFFSLSLAAAWF